MHAEDPLKEGKKQCKKFRLSESTVLIQTRQKRSK